MIAMKPHLSPLELADHLDRLACRIEGDLDQRGNRMQPRFVFQTAARARAFHDAASLIRLNEHGDDGELDPSEP